MRFLAVSCWLPSCGVVYPRQSVVSRVKRICVLRDWPHVFMAPMQPHASAMMPGTEMTLLCVFLLRLQNICFPLCITSKYFTPLMRGNELRTQFVCLHSHPFT